LGGPLPKLCLAFQTSDQDGQLNSFRGEDFFQISSPLFSIFSLAAILVGSRDHRTKFWKGAIQASFHQSFVAIGQVVSEEKIVM
jgi:hypothetical protein